MYPTVGRRCGAYPSGRAESVVRFNRFRAGDFAFGQVVAFNDADERQADFPCEFGREAGRDDAIRRPHVGGP